jgi:hypothetical protein
VKVVRLDTGKNWDQTTVAEEEIDDLDIAIAEAEQLKKARDTAARKYKQAEAKVIELLNEREEKTHISPLDGGWQATVVVGERVTINEDELHTRIGDQLWDHVTVRKFDKARLENCVSLGIIRGEDVAECATVETNSPYLRLTRHREQEPEEHDSGADQPPP